MKVPSLGTLTENRPPALTIRQRSLLTCLAKNPEAHRSECGSTASASDQLHPLVNAFYAYLTSNHLFASLEHLSDRQLTGIESAEVQNTKKKKMLQKFI